MRLFLAVDLPLALLRQVVTGTTELRKIVGCGRQLRWVAADNIHITLKFLGEVEKERVDQFSTCLAAISWTGFTLTLGRSGFFPLVNRPRVFWQGFSAGIEEMRELLILVESCAVGIGVPKEQRSYTPHLTLARIKTRKNREKSDAFSQLQKQVDNLLPVGSSFPVTVFSLYQSQLTPAGAIYTRLAAFQAPTDGISKLSC